MSSIAFQRDLVITYKKETLLNVKIVSKLRPMSRELSRLLKENALEKPTQNLFNHLTHYLVGIIDPQVSFSWPIETERVYRNELSAFISDYSSKGLLSPVISSYLVNPGCYKVVLLMFQMSRLAVQRVLLTQMKKDSQKELYKSMTDLYKTGNEKDFVESLNKESENLSNKISKFLAKKEVYESVAEKLRNQIIKLENNLNSSKAQEFIDNLVDGYIKTHELDEETKKEILEIKNVEIPAKIFDKWLDHVDNEIMQMESNWESKHGPFSEICHKVYQNTESLIARQTGEADKRTYTIEYNPKTDNIDTSELEKEVNANQKYILKNIIRDDRLSFPNLIRGFLVSISFILNNTEIGDEIFQFNQYLINGRQNYAEVVDTMKSLVQKTLVNLAKLQKNDGSSTSTVSITDEPEITLIPDIWNIKMNVEFHPQNEFSSFTPLNCNKHQFNLNRKKSLSLQNPLPKFITPLHFKRKEDFSQTLTTFNTFDMNATQNTTNLDVSAISHIRSNDSDPTRTGFSKEQIFRLLSTKKSSSSKKFKHKMERPNVKIVKGNLFNESMISNESIGVYRCHSSPNLYESREKTHINNLRARRLSIMKENSPSLLEMSGIAALERDSNHSTPTDMSSLDNCRKLIDSASLPSIASTPYSDNLKTEEDLNKHIEFKVPQFAVPKRKSKEKYEDRVTQRSRIPQPNKKKDAIENQIVLPTRKSNEMVEEAVVTQKNQELIQDQQENKEIFEEKILPSNNTEFKETGTPETNTRVIKSGSLEKIIKRFKKVRASTIPSELKEEKNFNTILEDRENHNFVNVDSFSANRNLLPDLLSPSTFSTKFNHDIINNIDLDDEDNKPRKGRESLGTVLGVDNTFLDQFDLSD